MLQKLTAFLRYDNTVPLLLGVVLIGAGSAFAASDGALNAVYSSSSRVVSVDNTYIANKDLSSWTPRATISGVTEDSDTYYVSYNLETIGLQDNAWRDVVLGKNMTIAKNALGGLDLGQYVNKQLGEVIAHELSFLKETQDIEKNHVTQAVVATEYSGLVGKFVDTSTQTLPTPAVASSPAPTTPVQNTQVASAATATTPAVPEVKMLGNNPAQITVGSIYNDLGVYVPTGETFSVAVTVDGVAASTASIDTAQAGTHTVVYIVSFPNKGTTSLTRTVIVASAAQDTTTQAATTPAAN